MKLEFDPPVNPNYAATIVRVHNLVKLPNSDFLQGVPMMGMQAIVGLDTKIGDLGILFPSEVQLSHEFCHHNNLYIKYEREVQNEDGSISVIRQNKDRDAKGYLEHNRRVKAIRLRGNRSDALFMPLSSVAFAFKDSRWTFFQEGDTFDTLNGIEICRKYVKPFSPGSGMQAAKKLVPRVEEKLFPPNPDSMHFQRVDRNLDPNAWCVVTQKLHGCQIRIGNVPVTRKLSFVERLARRLGVKVRESDYDMVFGSHHVIKDANNPNQRHFYETDLWTHEGRKLEGLIPQNYIVYGELIGWVPGRGTAHGATATEGYAPLQEHYTYDCAPGTCKLYVFRVTTVNAQGTIADLSWDAVKGFCAATGLNHVPELWRGQVHQLTDEGSAGLSLFLDTNFHESPNTDDITYSNAVPLSEDSPCDEGICIRLEGMIPTILKAKSPIFVAHETKMIDEGGADVESAETINEVR